MSDGSLSQDEIDALLQGGGGFDLGEEPAAEPLAAGGSEAAQSAFTDVLTGLADTLASNLTGLVGSSVTIGSPTVEMVSNGSFVSTLPPEVVQVETGFAGAVSGSHSLIFSPEMAVSIAGLMMGQEDVELNEAALSALEEAGNTLAGAEATVFSESSGGDVSTTPGSSKTGASGDLSVPPGEFVKATYPVTVEGSPQAELVEVFDASIMNALVGGGAASAPVEEAPMSLGGGDMGGDLGGLDLGGDLLGGGGGLPVQQGAPNVQAVQFAGLGAAGGGQEQGNISLLMDVFMEMTVELGRTKKLIRDILGMGEGTIIELDKLAGEPVDILVNHKLIAKGEVVVIDENFGVRVTEIVDPMDRVPEM